MCRIKLGAPKWTIAKFCIRMVVSNDSVKISSLKVIYALCPVNCNSELSNSFNETPLRSIEMFHEKELFHSNCFKRICFRHWVVCGGCNVSTENYNVILHHNVTLHFISWQAQLNVLHETCTQSLQWPFIHSMTSHFQTDWRKKSIDVLPKCKPLHCS